jgi:hypothetical protein
MVKTHQPGEPLLRFPTIDVAEIHDYSTAIADMYAGDLDGIIVRGVLPPDVIELVVGRLERGEFGMEMTTYLTAVNNGPLSLGRTLIGSPDIDAYFRNADEFREKFRVLFRDTVDFEQRFEQIVGALAGGLPVRVPSGPETGTYTSATIRVLPKGCEMHLHVGSDFLLVPQCQHLAGLVDGGDQLSYFMPLTNSESGGELIVYALEWEDMVKHYTAEGPSAMNAFILSIIESFETQANC